MSCPHQAVGGVDALVSLPSLRVHKFSVDEELVRHFHAHVVDVLLHLSRSQTDDEGHAVGRGGRGGGAYVVDHQLLFTVLSSELPDAHLDEILKGGVHVDVLVLQLAATGPELHLLHKSEEMPPPHQLAWVIT